MQEYLMSVIGAALIAGVIGALIPSESGEGLKKYVNLIGALCVLSVLIAPLSNVLDVLGQFANGDFDEWLEEGGGEFDRKYRDTLISVGKENIENGIVVLLGEKFGIPESECRVEATVREGKDGIELIGVRITLSGRSVLKDPYAIEKYISELLGCECRVD